MANFDLTIATHPKVAKEFVLRCDAAVTAGGRGT